MVNRHPPELFAQRPVRSDWDEASMRMRRRVTVAVLFVVAVVLGAGIYYGMSGSETPTGEVPVIKAEGPFKTVPDQPGGIDIPHQEQTVFNQIDKSAQGNLPAVEHLLPPPETPKPVGEDPATPKVAAIDIAGKTPEDIPNPPTSPAPVAAAPSPAPVVAVTPAPKMAKVPDIGASPVKPAPLESAAPVKAETKPAATAEATKVEPPGHLPEELFTSNTVTVPSAEPVKAEGTKTESAKASNNASDYRVQLGSFPDQSVAQKELKKLQSRNAKALGKASLKLTRVDLESKGVFYRIQSKPMTESDARKLCAALTAQKASCWVVKP